MSDSCVQCPQVPGEAQAVTSGLQCGSQTRIGGVGWGTQTVSHSGFRRHRLSRAGGVQGRASLAGAGQASAAGLRTTLGELAAQERDRDMCTEEGESRAHCKARMA